MSSVSIQHDSTLIIKNITRTLVGIKWRYGIRPNINTTLFNAHTHTTVPYLYKYLNRPYQSSPKIFNYLNFVSYHVDKAEAISELV